MAKKITDPNSVKLDGHDFNKKSILAYKTEKAFLAAANDEDNTEKNKSNHKETWFPNDPDRTEKLKEVWKLANATK